ncbi:MAG TPA: phosphatidylserine/phosphatidylglycerophosphate/cardiolipin synthase family protein [bacterium]|nr:phosphatidylserine/phosphatidylglycerophosphate/cardiolipin synthase family protein [bacterium]
MASRSSEDRPTPILFEKAWSGERLYFKGDDYFRDLLAAIGRARRSIEIETYIFESGNLADRIIQALKKARRRGVRVQLMVDGVGSPEFAGRYGPELKEAGIPFRVYRSWPTFFSSIFQHFDPWKPFASLRYASALFNRGKHRDHRKQFILDGQEVWLGSFNVSDWHLEKVKKDQTWRDTGLRLTGVTSPVFSLAFQVTWQDPWPHRFRRSFRRFLIGWLSRDLPETPVRLTASRKLRRAFRWELLGRMELASDRIRVMTPYFVPTGPLLRALALAARRGCKVELLLPGHSDVPIVRWASWIFYPALLKAGCRIFEYQGRVLHAKGLQIDDWVLVGSSNLDHRSLRKDLEVNVILQERHSRAEWRAQWAKDLKACREVTRKDLEARSLWARALSALFFHFRYWF